MDDDCIQWGDPPSPPPKNNWDDEDVDDEYVKECWEDESVKESSEGDHHDQPNPHEPAACEKDPIDEKIQRQRLVEEADYKKANEKTLDNFTPKTASDFAEYAELVARKLRQYEKSRHYVQLLKSVMRSSLSSSRGADVKEVASSVTEIANEKMKAEAKRRRGQARDFP